MKALSADTIRLLCSSQVITSVLNVVKELLENSLDAGASSVDVKLENYGLDRIEVRDNGSGIEATDAPVMAVKHYTSKISSHQDLEHLETYGFRGEALGSLCAVSEVALTTKTAADDISTQYTLDPTGKVISQKPSHLGQGTTVCALKLFKNLPVRRQFYSTAKKCSGELKKVQDLLMAYGVIKPELRITFSHNKAVVWQKPRVSDHRTALLAVLGTAAVANLLPLQHRQEQPEITIDGYFPKPGSDFAQTSSSNSDRTFIFVNNRPVRDKEILKVVRQQYNSQHGKDSAHSRYPTLMMSITVPACAVDVNLTPDKTQVMLHDKEAVLSAVQAMFVSLSGPQTGSDPTPPPAHAPSSSTDPSPQAPAPGGLWAGPGADGLTTPRRTSTPGTPSHGAEDPRPGTPDSSSATLAEPAGNHTANTSSSSSCEDWLVSGGSWEVNGGSWEVEADSSAGGEDALLGSAGRSDLASGPGRDPFANAAEIPADRWSAGRAFSDRDTGERLEPVKIHRPADAPAGAQRDPKPSLGQTKAPNAVTGRMTTPTAYDLISSSAVRRPLSASAMFQQETRPTILLENPKASRQEVTAAMEERWEKLPEAERLKYEESAERDVNRYELQSQRALERGAGASERERSQRVLERGAGASEHERRGQALKRKAPLSNQMILDQLFSSQPPRKKSASKPWRLLPFSVSALRTRLRLPSHESARDPQSLGLVNSLTSSRAWVVTRGVKLALFSPSRAEEALLLQRLLEDHVLPTVHLRTPIPLTDGVLGGAEFSRALCGMESERPESSGEAFFSDPRLLSNGFQIRLIPGPASSETRLEVAGMADCVPYLGVSDLKDILTAVIERKATSVRASRPLKVISYLEGEAVRAARQLPVQRSREQVMDMLSRAQQLGEESCGSCIHGRPFFHHLVDIPETEQDALQILSSTPSINTLML